MSAAVGAAHNRPVQWNPQQYQRYAGERGRPFLDLVARIGAEQPRRVTDLGCGPGEYTALLSDRWPGARITGIDSSGDMVEAAREHARPGRLHFRQADIADYAPDEDTDVLVSNAALQWVPGHRAKIEAWLHALGSGAWIAWQVPGNFGAPSHRLLRELTATPRWASRLGGTLEHHAEVAEPADYASLLLDRGWHADVWETTYLHLLTGDDPVVGWMRGTGLRPVLAALDESEQVEFEATYAAALRAAYPAAIGGTLFPFRRIFAVGRKP